MDGSRYSIQPFGIVYPQQGTTYATVLRSDGFAPPGTFLTVTTGDDVYNSLADDFGKWRIDLEIMSCGTHTICAEAVCDGQTARDSVAFTIDRYVPAPVIMFPSKGEIVQPSFTAKGIGVLGNTVLLKLDGTSSKGVKVDDNGSFEYDYANICAGTHRLGAVQIEGSCISACAEAYFSIEGEKQTD